MILAVLATEAQKKEIAGSVFFQQYEVVYSENDSLWPNHAADAFLDLSGDLNPERIVVLAKLLPKPVLVNAVVNTLDQIHPDFIRVNGWPGFLGGDCLEAAANGEARNAATRLFGEKLVFVKDIPGFVSARVVAMIIHEAYFTFEAGVSTQAAIDTAMKLGTGYPRGPFEWSELIGISNVEALLNKLTVDG